MKIPLVKYEVTSTKNCKKVQKRIKLAKKLKTDMTVDCYHNREGRNKVYIYKSSYTFFLPPS